MSPTATLESPRVGLTLSQIGTAAKALNNLRHIYGPHVGLEYQRQPNGGVVAIFPITNQFGVRLVKLALGE